MTVILQGPYKGQQAGTFYTGDDEAALIASGRASYPDSVNAGGGGALSAADRALIATASTAQPSLYLGQVSNRCVIPNFKGNTSVTWTMSRTVHYAYADIVNPTFVYPNVYIQNGSDVETSPGAGTLKLGVELIEGGTPVAANEGVVNTTFGLVFFTVTGTIKAGTFFALRPLATNATGALLSAPNVAAILPTRDACEFGSGTATDKTTSGTIGRTAGAAYAYFPCAILGQTRLPSVTLFGDSITVGAFDIPGSGRGDVGYGRLVGQAFPYINIAVSATSMQSFLAATTTQRQFRTALAAYTSHGCNFYGRNEAIPSGAPGMATRRTQIAALFPNLIMGGGTLMPAVSATTDSYATVAGQTADTGASAIAPFNALQRAGIDGERFSLDVDDIANPLRRGVWPVERSLVGATGTANFATKDGTHPEPALYEIIADRGAGQLSRIRR